MPQMPDVAANEVVFEFDQETRPMWNVQYSQTYASWADVVKGKRTLAISGGNKGMCMTMVASWVRAVRQHNSVVATFTDMRSLHRIAIAHAAYRVAGADVLDVLGIREESLDYEDHVDLDAHPEQILAWVNSARVEVFFALYLETPAEAGHVVGIQTGPGRRQFFFDPNYGLYRFVDRLRLTEFLRKYVRSLLEITQERNGSWSLAALSMV
jgi:hypothetical protein